MSTPLPIDLQQTPFSAYGNWMSFSRPQPERFQPKGPGLYLRTHHFRPLSKRELFLLQPMKDGKTVAFKEVIETHRMTLVPEEGEGYIEIFFDGDKTIRMRGENLDLTLLTARAGQLVGYSEGENRFTVNARQSHRRYEFDMIEGDLSWDAPFEVDHSPQVDLHLKGQSWEVAIDEFISTWVRPERESFDQALSTRLKDWEAFASAFPENQQGWAKGSLMAKYILWSCTMCPSGQLERPSVFMSLNWMDQVWSWDNLFNAASLASGHPDLARDQILVVADHQDEYGAYPDGLNDQFKHYNFSKPPVQGLLLSWIREHSPSFWNEDRQKELYPSIKAFTLWWLKYRRWKGETLCHYLHGNDSGWDNTTLLRKGAPIQCPDLNAFLVVQCRLLAEMASVVGDTSEDWNEHAQQLQDALLGTLWNGKEFCGRLLSTGELVDSRSLVSCMPLVLGKDLPADTLSQTIERVKSFITDHGPATEQPDSPHYDPDGYWRGPIWAPSTFLIVQGLLINGEEALAKDVARRFCHTCQNSTMAENFDALTGEGLRDLAYTWTSAVFLELSRLVKA